MSSPRIQFPVLIYFSAKSYHEFKGGAKYQITQSKHLVAYKYYINYDMMLIAEYLAILLLAFNPTLDFNMKKGTLIALSRHEEDVTADY